MPQWQENKQVKVKAQSKKAQQGTSQVGNTSSSAKQQKEMQGSSPSAQLNQPKKLKKPLHAYVIWQSA